MGKQARGFSPAEIGLAETCCKELQRRIAQCPPGLHEVAILCRTGKSFGNSAKSSSTIERILAEAATRDVEHDPLLPLKGPNGESGACVGFSYVERHLLVLLFQLPAYSPEHPEMARLKALVGILEQLKRGRRLTHWDLLQPLIERVNHPGERRVLGSVTIR